MKQRIFSTKKYYEQLVPKYRIKRMEKEIPAESSEDFEFYNIRIEKLKRLIKASGRLLPALARLFKL